MLAIGLHALGPDCPDSVGKIDFVPRCLAHFAAPCRGQDSKFECAGGNAGVLTQALHEGGQISIRQRSLVLSLAIGRGKGALQIVAPASWIVPAAHSLHRRPVENRLDATSYTTRRLVLCLPYW